MKLEYKFIRCAYEPNLEEQMNEAAKEGWFAFKVFRSIERGAFPSENRFFFQVILQRWAKEATPDER